MFYHRRAIYGFWDLLSDIGGLYDILKSLSLPVVHFVVSLLGSGLDRYLIAKLFKFEAGPSRITQRGRIASKLNAIKFRKSALITVKDWLLS